jgi:hypothetical protein
VREWEESLVDLADRDGHDDVGVVFLSGDTIIDLYAFFFPIRLLGENINFVGEAAVLVAS